MKQDRTAYPESVAVDGHMSHYGAMCIRRRDDDRDVQILLIASRDSGRWVIPKGRPMRHRKAHEVARLEAWEEAGVRGRVCKAPCGAFHYDKTHAAGRVEPCQVQVHRLVVSCLIDDFPEAGERQRRWFTPIEAAAAVHESGLQALFRALEAA